MLMPPRETQIAAAEAYVAALFAADSGRHDAAHTLRVRRNAMRIAAEEPGCDLLAVELAALLHDADDHKLFRTEGNANARRFLEREGVPAETIARVCAAIDSVSFSADGGRRRRRGGSSRTPTGWTPSAPSASPAALPTAASTDGRWRSPYSISMTSCCC